MLKITLQIQEDKGKDTCTVKMINPKTKDLEKASDNEKRVGAIVQQKINTSLKELTNWFKN